MSAHHPTSRRLLASPRPAPGPKVKQDQPGTAATSRAAMLAAAASQSAREVPGVTGCSGTWRGRTLDLFD